MFAVCAPKTILLRSVLPRKRTGVNNLLKFRSDICPPCEATEQMSFRRWFLVLALEVATGWHSRRDKASVAL
jgi:hypothetical protein